MSTARVSLAEVFDLGCVGRGLDRDLKVRPAAAAGIYDFAPLGLRLKNMVFERLAPITGQKFQGVGLRLTSSC